MVLDTVDRQLQLLNTKAPVEPNIHIQEHLIGAQLQSSKISPYGG
jgi:hypothetical protein